MVDDPERVVTSTLIKLNAPMQRTRIHLCSRLVQSSPLSYTPRPDRHFKNSHKWLTGKQEVSPSRNSGRAPTVPAWNLHFYRANEPQFTFFEPEPAVWNL